MTAVVAGTGITKQYSTRRWLRRVPDGAPALAGVDLELQEGRIVGLVGESGSGKSTLGRILLRLDDPTSGTVHLDGVETTRLRGEALRRLRPRMQLVFQDPIASLNPRRTVARSVAEPLVINRIGDAAARRARVEELFRLVHLDPALGSRRPHELSGGQRQRVGIARAIATDPRFLVCDEALASLDVTIQARIVTLLRELRDRLGLTVLFITHDLATAGTLCDDLVVLQSGRVVESGTAADVLRGPVHPYTRTLIRSVPVPDPAAERARRSVSLADPGYRVAVPCPHDDDGDVPDLVEVASGHRVACHRIGPPTTETRPSRIP